MDEKPAGRGVPADGRQAGTMPEKLAGVLARIADKPRDAPVVVSAGFLRWLMKSDSEYKRERDEARAVAKRMLGRAEASAKLLAAADQRIAGLRAEIAVLTGRPAAVEWKFARVTDVQLADYELAGWDVREIEMGRIANSALVALRREGVKKVQEPVKEAERDTKPIPKLLTAPEPPLPEMATAASIEARLPQKQIDMLLAVRDGADIIPRHAGTRRALREAGLVEIIGKPAEWKMTLTPAGAAVLAAYRVRRGKDAA